ncbi:nitroreductase family protein [Solwaraspora sp. WMMD937]|uniref:nitroreductase family protein n=1 Tax=Solwaraspora sp. WMMD937 TaxID=3016090 RepID=UPI00249A5243|nr:nitroreductase family protein [Solwaraspora sp. WMMD937]WFE19177.1 nitroreductase family protein [Solwaraspora sp. WMMD937]
MSSSQLTASQLTATLAEVYAHGPGKDVRPAPAPPYRRRPTDPAVPFAELAAVAGPTGARLVRTLGAALAPRRFEPWNGFNEHRAYPSPRAAHLVDVLLRHDGLDWLVDPVRELLYPTSAESLVAAPDGSVELVLREQPTRMPAGYGRLAEALAALEAGHVAGALAEAAAGHGLRYAVGTATTTSGPWLTVTLGPSTMPTWSRHRLRAVRSSGLSPRGFGADPRPMPTEAFERLVAAAYRPPAGSPVTGVRLRHTVAVGNVAGRTAGWYHLDPAATGRPGAAAPRPTRPGDATGQVQRAYSYPRTEVDVAGMPLAWLVSADVPAAVRTGGPAAYRRLLHAAGAAAQHVGTAAAEAGLFCRPVRAVREAAAEAAAGLPAGHDLIYLLLIGRSRVRDFAYDLSNPEVSP